MERNKKVVLGITGGIAAFKAARIASLLTQQEVDVHVIMTKSAQEFITPLTLQTLTRNPVSVDTFDERNPQVVNHIDLADHADLFLIAPATANLIGKLAHGLADDMLSTTLLATEAPIVMAPAMNVHMYTHSAVQANLNILRNRGVMMLDPASGQLACGYVGQGRMVEPEAIVDWLNDYWKKNQKWIGKKVLITAGPTVEPIDPVRFLSNHSSGKMGYALAQAAKDMGAEVTLVSGPVSLPPPSGVRLLPVQTALEMHDVVINEFAQSDLTIKAAAVSDYRPEEIWSQKIKKNTDQLEIRFVKNPDIAEELGRRKRPGQILVGFAAETQKVEEYALSKLQRKGLDLIIANQVNETGSGFGVDTNRVTLLDAQGRVERLPQLDKKEVARRILHWIEDHHDV